MSARTNQPNKRFTRTSERKIGLRELRICVFISDNGGLGRAAERLNIAQPAVSRSLKQLEERIGTTLFLRLPTGMVPTPAGEAFVERARHILAELSELAHEFDDSASGVRGTVKIGAMPIATYSLLPDVLKELNQLYPDIQVVVREGSADDLLSLLQNHQIDIAIGRLNLTLSASTFRTEILYTDNLCFLVRDFHPLAGRAGVHVSDVIEFPLVLPERESPAYEALLTLYRLQGEPVPLGEVFTNSIGLICNLIAQSNMVGVVPQSILNLGDALPRLQMLDMDFSHTAAPFGLTTLRKPDTDPIVECVVTIVRGVARLIAERDYT